MYYKRDLVEKIEEYLGTSKIIVFLDQGKWVKLLDEFKLEVILETVQKVGNGSAIYFQIIRRISINHALKCFWTESLEF